MELGLEIWALLFFVAMIAGWFDSIAGGGGLITVPVLMLVGVPPVVALATNKLQGSVGSFAASLYFFKKGVFQLREIRWLIVFTFIGSVIGSWLILEIKSENLMVVIPILLILMGLYFLFSPHVSDQSRKKKLTHISFALLVCPLIGFYDGFFGPGTGSFMALAFVLFLGFGLPKATAHAKVLNFVSNISSLLYFMVFGEIYWGIGIVMMIGQYCGATLGAKMVFNHGTALIKPILVSVCFLMSINILIKSYW